MGDETTARSERRGGKSRFALGFIAASALWVALTLLAVEYWRTPDHGSPAVPSAADQIPAPSPSPIVNDAPDTRQTVAALVAQRLASLHVPAKNAILPSDLALQADVAIKHGDFATANRIASTVLARSKLSGWWFYPFDDFMDNIIGAGNDPQLASQLNEWRQRAPDSPLAYLISAQYFWKTAWAVRSNDFNWEVPANDMHLFRDDVAAAASDVRQSIALDPHTPWSYLLLLQAVSCQGNSAEMEAVFQQAIHAFPTYYQLYEQRLDMLAPKWGGSVQAMYAFADRYAGQAPTGSPLKLLYLQLYANLADAAVVDCKWRYHSVQDGCMRAEMSHTLRPRMENDLLQALRLYKVSDPIAYSNALWPILGNVVLLSGSNDWSGIGALLQMTAQVMGSDEQLTDNHPGHNNYVLDELTAMQWDQIGNASNAEQKFAEALSDIEHTNFPDEARKNRAMAIVYERMAQVADYSGQYVDVIAYQAAANAIAGSNHGGWPYETCYAYYKLNLAQQAIKECTRLIDGNGNYVQTRYWRAASYQEMHDWQAALAGFAPIADGANNWFRVRAAISMSVIYGERHDYPGLLASLNEHPYLFDPAMQSHDDLAIAFNNRCDAYMELGHLHKALADCTASLKYEHTPDAYQKELELISALRSRSTL
jgi:Domain of unknown function (DUF4034)